MLDPQTLRGRLTLSYAAALVVSLVLFGVLALAVIDRAQRSALNAQLTTSAHAILAIVEGQQGRVIMDEADTARLSDILGAKANAAVWQRSGTLVATSGRGSFPQLQRLALAAEAPRFADLEVDGASVRAYMAPIASGPRRAGALAIWRETGAIADLDRAVAIAFAFAIPVLAGMAILFGAAIARRALAPLDRIATLASEIEAHDLSARLALPPRSDELGRLAATFDRMLGRLQSAFERERRFTSDASHELRAPLSVIRAEADLALRRDRSGEEYRSALRAIAEDADALEAITSDLLDAARAEAEGDVRIPISLSGIAREAAASMRVIAAQRGVTLDVRGEDGVRVLVAHDAILRAVVAVVHNGIKYAGNGGTVRLDADRDGSEAVLRITDDGPGFSTEGLEHAFQRFWRAEDSRTRDGSGLGLSIAHAAVTANAGTLRLQNVTQGGAAVYIRFPAVAEREPG